MSASSSSSVRSTSTASLVRSSVFYRINVHLWMLMLMMTCLALLTIPPPQFKLFMDSIIWAIKHTMRDIAETGLNCTYSCVVLSGYGSSKVVW